MQQCRHEGFIIYPTANQQGCATIPFEFAQAAEQRQKVMLQKRAMTQTPVAMTIAPVE
jgi:hypothetical protein